MAMRSLIAALLFALALGCTAAPDAPPRQPQTGGTPPPVASTPTPAASPTSTPPPARRNVTLAEPVEGQLIQSNPFRISGTARTFENNVVIRIRDERGQLFHETFATARGPLGSFNPWETDILLTAHPGSSLTVDAFEISAKDGSVESLVRVWAPYAVPSRTVTLYAHDPERAPTDCRTVFPYLRDVPNTLSLARLLVEALMAMPASPYPQGAEIGRIVVNDGVATVDFNERMQNVGGSCRAQAIRAGLERTLTQLPNVTRIVIRAGGSEKLALQP